MTRAMYSAVSGLSANQMRMDVIGNDLANVNTVGYKRSRATIGTAFDQVARSASQYQTSGIIIGLGAQIQSTDTQFTQGAFQRTDVPSDVGLSGDGFFVLGSGVENAAVPDATLSAGFFTRAGNFLVDQFGFLRTPDGYYVLGDQGTIGGVLYANAFTNGVAAVNPNNLSPHTLAADQPLTTAGTHTTVRIPSTIINAALATENVASYSIGTDGKVVVTGDQGTQSAVGFIRIAVFQNNQGLNPYAGTKFQATQASGAGSGYPAGTGSAGKTQSGVLELSNVDMASEFSDMIVTQRGFDANAKTVTTSDDMLSTVVNMKR